MQGIRFDNIHSYFDFNLVLSEVNIPPATPKTNFIDIPGGDGSVDLTEALGDVKFKDRECKFTFTVFPYDDFETKKRQVSNLLNGKRYAIILDKDPNYCWFGRCRVDEYKSNKNLHQIVIGATVEPYKYKFDTTVVIVPAGDKITRTLTNGRKVAVPTIICTAETTITFNRKTITFNAGTHRNVELALVQGDNRITVTSTQSVTIRYQEGEL